MRAKDYYCPRCDKQTEWLNVANHGNRYACAICGLEEGGRISQEEVDRIVAFKAAT